MQLGLPTQTYKRELLPGVPVGVPISYWRPQLMVELVWDQESYDPSTWPWLQRHMYQDLSSKAAAKRCSGRIAALPSRLTSHCRGRFRVIAARASVDARADGSFRVAVP